MSQCLLEIGDFLCIAEGNGLDLCFHGHFKALHVLLDLAGWEASQLLWQLINLGLGLLMVLCKVQRNLLLFLFFILFREMLFQIVFVDIVDVHVLNVLHKVRLLFRQLLHQWIVFLNQNRSAFPDVNFLSFVILSNGSLFDSWLLLFKWILPYGSDDVDISL